MQLKLLLDENISPAIAHTLCTEDSVDACSIRDRGKLGIGDEEVLDFAFSEDRILVTANVSDFVALAQVRELHAGIILIDDGCLERPVQLQIIRQAIAMISAHGDLINQALRVAIGGAMTIEQLPATS